MGFDLTGLSLYGKQVPEFGKFIAEKALQTPELKAVHNVYTGIKTNDYIVLAGQLGLAGKKANGCTVQSSGATSVLSQKQWTPAKIVDTLETCIASQSQNFQAYQDKINSFKEQFDGTGSDEMMFLAALVVDAMKSTIARAIWLGDTNVAASTGATAGLISASNIYAFNYFDGLWKQIFTGVTTGTVTKVAISENTPSGSPAALGSMNATKAEAYIASVYKAADSRLRNDLSANILVDGQTFMYYCDFLASKGENFTIDYTMEGFTKVKYRGHNVINMETVWDTNLAYFEDENDLPYLPYRIAFVAPANIPVGTISENDLEDVESWFDRDTQLNKTRFGFSLDAKLLDEKLIVVAY